MKFNSLLFTLLCLLMALTVARVAQAQCVPKPAGIVAWWKAENNAVDSIGGANGTLFNGASYAAGEVGQAFTFDGVDDRISVPDVAALHFSGSFSIETWVSPTKYTVGHDGIILLRGDNRTEHDPYVLSILRDGRISFYIQSNTQEARVSSAAPIPVNVFTHVVATMNATTGEMKLYINGALSNSITTTVRQLVELDQSQNPGVGIANTGAFPNTSYNFPFPGLIDEVSLYNRALTAKEVQDLYNAGSGGKCNASPTLVVSDPTPTKEGSAVSPGSVSFDVKLSFPITYPVTVSYATADGLTNGAKAGSDYTSASGTLTFAPGETTKTVRVGFIGDDVLELDENFSFTLGNATNADITQGQATATILNDEPGPTISINDVSVKENNTTIAAIFTLTLSKATPYSVKVDYATSDDSAISPADYTSAAVTLTFAPGETTKTLSVFVRGDTLDENDETFRLALSNPVNGEAGDMQGFGTIVDDDAPPAATIDDVSVFEGNNGTVNATFTVDLSARSSKSISLNAIPTNGTAKAPDDYSSGGFTLVFAPGETRKTVSVPVKGDLLNETDELFYVFLSSPVNCSLSKARGIGTIYDDDAKPSISIDDVRIGEGNSGQRIAAFRLVLSAPSGQLVKVNYATTAGSATAGNDYVEVAPTPVAFTTGSLYAYARVPINGDLLNELDESFVVSLSNSINATIDDSSANGIILNDDSAPAITVNDVSIAEGNAGTKNLTFTISLSKPSGQSVSVNLATVDGTAKAGSDYTAQTGTFTFSAGETSKMISVVINGDATEEADETLYIFLSNSVNASIGKARGIGTITNDDASG